MYKNSFKFKIVSLWLLMFFTVTFSIPSVVYAGNIIRTIEGTVTKVSDGDTIVVTTADGTKVKLRLAGIDASETQKFNKKGEMVKPGQPFGDEAYQFVENLILNQQIRADIYGIDQYKRDIAFVFYKDLNINAELVRNGLAEVYKGGEYGPYKAELYELEKVAKLYKAGIWSLGDKYESPRNFRKRLRIKGE